MLFTYLNEYAVEGASIKSIQWGSEKAKLTPPGALAAALAAGVPTSTLFPKLPTPAPSAQTPDSKEESAKPTEEKEAQAAPPAGPVSFFPDFVLINICGR